VDALKAVILSAGLMTGLAALTVILLRSSFLRLLVELCRSESHGRFWLVYACVAIVLTSLFGALMSVPGADATLWKGAGSIGIVVTAFRTGLFGLLLSLAAVALVLLVSIGQRRVDPGTAGQP
jgi:hypothetical protein